MSDRPRLYHYSHSPVNAFDPDLVKPIDDFSFKPSGLWFSLDNAWERWCIDNYFYPGNLRVRTEIILNERPNTSLDETDKVLWLHTWDDVMDFNHRYVTGIPNIPASTTQYIDWKAVTERWQGIIIVNPFRPRQSTMGPLWVYSWDVPSGCVWDGDAITIKSHSITETTTYTKTYDEGYPLYKKGIV